MKRESSVFRYAIATRPTPVTEMIPDADAFRNLPTVQACCLDQAAKQIADEYCKNLPADATESAICVLVVPPGFMTFPCPLFALFMVVQPARKPESVMTHEHN